MKNDISKYNLLEEANATREKAYCPYSNISVGAAVLCRDGSVYTGCNVENASSPVGICAERVALSKAISEGRRDFQAIAISGGRHGQAGTPRFTPCGICRQFMSELCGEDFEIILSGEDMPVTYTLGELLPYRFSDSML